MQEPLKLKLISRAASNEGRLLKRCSNIDPSTSA
jgi:hypothetical protein